MGHNVLSNATVLHSNINPKMKINNEPNITAELAKDVIEPLSLGSVISPTYDNIGASLNPMLNPINTLAVKSKHAEWVKYKVIHPIILGMFAKIIHFFLPNLS